SKQSLGELLILLSMHSEKLLSGLVRQTILSARFKEERSPDRTNRGLETAARRQDCLRHERKSAPTEWSPYRDALPTQANGRLIPPGNARLRRDCLSNNSLP